MGKEEKDGQSSVRDAKKIQIFLAFQSCIKDNEIAFIIAFGSICTQNDNKSCQN